jgi:Spy/CpxP family protein refolding chaperone
MNSNSRTRRLIITIVILLITNIAILAFFLLPKYSATRNAGEARSFGMAETLRKEVGLDSQQVKQLNSLRQEHWKKMKPMFEDLQQSKSQFFQFLKAPETPDSVINAAASAIAEKQKLIDLQMFQHFRNSRLVCRPEQRPKYDSIVQVAVRRMSGGARGPNNRRHDDRDGKQDGKD